MHLSESGADGDGHVSLGILWSKTGPLSDYAEFLRICAKSCQARGGGEGLGASPALPAHLLSVLPQRGPLLPSPTWSQQQQASYLAVFFQLAPDLCSSGWVPCTPLEVSGEEPSSEQGAPLSQRHPLHIMWAPFPRTLHLTSADLSLAPPLGLSALWKGTGRIHTWTRP